MRQWSIPSLFSEHLILFLQKSHTIISYTLLPRFLSTFIADLIARTSIFFFVFLFLVLNSLKRIYGFSSKCCCYCRCFSLPATTAITTASHSQTFLIVRFIMAIYIIFKTLHCEMWNELEGMRMLNNFLGGLEALSL